MASTELSSEAVGMSGFVTKGNRFAHGLRARMASQEPLTDKLPNVVQKDLGVLRTLLAARREDLLGLTDVVLARALRGGAGQARRSAFSEATCPSLRDGAWGAVIVVAIAAPCMSRRGTRKGDGVLYKAAIVVGTLATAVIHLLYVAPNFDGVMMGLSGLGYVGLLGLLYLPIPIAQRHHRLVRRVLT